MQEVYHTDEEARTKKCSQCHKELSVQLFHRMGNGYRPSCKECRKERDLHPVIVQLLLFTKICTKCGKERFQDEFDAHESGKYGRQSHCKECRSTYNKQFRLDNIEKFREYDQSRVGDPKRNESHRKRYQEAYSQDPRYREQRRKSSKKSYQEHPLRYLEYTLRRRARIKETEISEVNYERILERDGPWCYICERDILPHHKLSFDHVIPLVPRRPDHPQGTHTEDNIRPAHGECNNRKSNRRFEDLTPFHRRGVNYQYSISTIRILIDKNW